MIIQNGSYNYDNWDNQINAIVYELSLINYIFSQYFPNFDVSNLTVSFDTTETSDAPICYRFSNTIILNANMIYWSQIAYQYCHELCHYCILEGIPQEFKWFEESICELASVYFMKKLSDIWSRHNFFPEYSHSIEEYADSILTDDRCAAINISDLLHNSAFFQEMSKDQYLRDNNRTVAKFLLKYFNENSILWSQVPKLSLIKNVYSFESFLLEWSNITDPSAKNSILSILSGFKEESRVSLEIGSA